MRLDEDRALMTGSNTCMYLWPQTRDFMQAQFAAGAPGQRRVILRQGFVIAESWQLAQWHWLPTISDHVG
jgi:hypothetical protein